MKTITSRQTNRRKRVTGKIRIRYPLFIHILRIPIESFNIYVEDLMQTLLNFVLAALILMSL